MACLKEDLCASMLHLLIQESRSEGNTNVSRHISDRLRFTNVKASDRMGGRAYACMAMNGIMRKSTQGPQYFINPQGGQCAPLVLVPHPS